MSAAGPKSLHLFGVSAAYRIVSNTTKSASMSEPANVILALPLAAVLGAVVRSPVSVLTGSPWILPVVANTRCTLLTALVLWLDCLSSVAASGSGPLLFFDDEEQAPTSAVAMVKAASTAISRHTLWRVCIPRIVEGGFKCSLKRGPPSRGAAVAGSPPGLA